MQVNQCYGKNIYIESKLVGYIARNELYISGRKFADITDDGEISMGDKYIGYVDEDGYIIVKEKEVGYIDADNNFVFYPDFMSK